MCFNPAHGNAISTVQPLSFTAGQLMVPSMKTACLATGKLVIQVSVAADLLALTRHVVEDVRRLQEFLQFGEALLPDQWFDPSPANLVAGIERVHPDLVIVAVTLEEQFHVLVVEVHVVVEPGHARADVGIFHLVARVEILVIPQQGDTGFERSGTAIVHHAEGLRPFRPLPHRLIESPVDRDGLGGPKTRPRLDRREPGEIDLANLCPTTELRSRCRTDFHGSQLADIVDSHGHVR